MSRWQPNARERLERAARELFVEQGFAATTVPEITARAGLTTRTFFRHFADKREVLFAGEEIPDLATRLLADAPATTDPATLIIEGLRAVAADRFDRRKDEVRQWRAIVASDEGLGERDLKKRAGLREAVRVGFLHRGVDATTAMLLAEISVTLLHVAIDEWLAREDDQTLSDTILPTLDALEATIAGFAGARVSGSAAPAL